MTRDKHPKDRAERLRLREKKEQSPRGDNKTKQEAGAINKIRRRTKTKLREKEAIDAVTLNAQ